MFDESQEHKAYEKSIHCLTKMNKFMVHDPRFHSCFVMEDYERKQGERAYVASAGSKDTPPPHESWRNYQDVPLSTL